MTSGASAMSSATYLRMSSGLPAAQRVSKRALRPSTQPDCCSTCTNVASADLNSTFSRGTPSSTPMRRMRSLCCACAARDRKSTRLNSSHTVTSYAVVCLKKKTYGHLYSHFTQLDIDHIALPMYLDKGLGFFLDPKVKWEQAPSVYWKEETWTAVCDTGE